MHKYGEERSPDVDIGGGRALCDKRFQSRLRKAAMFIARAVDALDIRVAKPARWIRLAVQPTSRTVPWS